MNTKPNPWMISTLLLVGFIIGFGGGQFFGSKGEAKKIDQKKATVERKAPDEEPGSFGEISLRPVTDEDHIRGAKDAKVTIVEFSDIECPFCKRFHPTMQRLVESYPNDVRWVYRHFPLDSLHSKARKEAEATECAAEQGGNDAFWKYTDKLFEITPSNDRLELSELPKIAEQIGLNRGKFEECLKSGRFAAHVAADLEDAVNSGGQGTPHSILIGPNGEKRPLSGALPYELVQQEVEALLKGD